MSAAAAVKKHWPTALEGVGFLLWSLALLYGALYRPAYGTVEESTQSGIIGGALMLGELMLFVAAAVEWRRYAHSRQPRWRALLPTAFAALPFVVVAVRELARALA